MTIAELYAAHKSELTAKLTVFSRDAHAAEDAVQQAYLSALTSGVAEQVPEGALKPWLYKTAKNALIDEKRKLARWTPLETDMEIQIDEPDADDMLFLRELLEKLPREQRELVSLRYLTGLDSAQIGLMLGIPAATVRTRLRAALKRLRSHL